MTNPEVQTMSKSEMIIKLLEEGKTYAQIQADLGVSPSKISEIKKRYLSDGNKIEDGNTKSELNKIESTTEVNNSESSTDNQLNKNNMTNINAENNNPEILLKIKKMEQDHEVVMKELELTKLELENKLLEINTTPDEVVLELQSRINDLEIENADLESDIEDLSYQVDELEDSATQNYHVEEGEVEQNSEEEAEENEEVEEHFIDSEGDLTENYFGTLIDFFARIIEADGCKLNENEISEIFESSKKYLEIFKTWLKNNDEDREDHVEPNLLYLVKEELKSLKKRLVMKGKEKIKMKLNDEVLELLDSYLEEE